MASNEEFCICLTCNKSLNIKDLQGHLLNHVHGSITIIPVSLNIYNDVDKNCEINFSSEIETLSNGEMNLIPTSHKENLVNNEISKYMEVRIHSDSSKRLNYPSKFKVIHVCSVCGKEFKRKDHLMKHTAVHSGAKPFTCLICGKCFSRKDRLKEHCVIHLANGWSCYFCGKMFSQRCILRKHEMIHRGVKPYMCDLCDRRFSRKNDLRRHTTSHTGEKNHFCDICGKGFGQKRLAKRHLQVHAKKSNAAECSNKLINL